MSAAYSELRRDLISQQEDMCCYCEIALKPETYAHVEHLKCRSKYPNAIYDFNNLLASCNGRNSDSCGHKKSNHYFDDMVSPLDKDCEKRFTYTGTGKIIAKDENDLAAVKTIELLGLNCKRLKERRETLIKKLEKINNEYLKQALENCVEWYGGFYTVIHYLIAKHC